MYLDDVVLLHKDVGHFAEILYQDCIQWKISHVWVMITDVSNVSAIFISILH